MAKILKYKGSDEIVTKYAIKDSHGHEIDVDAKQDKLTPGTNITIENNVIKANLENYVKKFNVYDNSENVYIQTKNGTSHRALETHGTPGGIPYIRSDGVFAINKYLDFRYNGAQSTGYTRLKIDSDSDSGIDISFPSESGQLLIKNDLEDSITQTNGYLESGNLFNALQDNKKVILSNKCNIDGNYYPCKLDWMNVAFVGFRPIVLVGNLWDGANFSWMPYNAKVYYTIIQ